MEIEQVQEQATQEQGAQTGPLAAQFQQVAERLAMLTLDVAQAREGLRERGRQRAALDAEITQRRLRLEHDERELLQLQGAATALQQAMQTQQGQTQQPTQETSHDAA